MEVSQGMPLRTQHQFKIGDSRNIDLPTESVDLVVTSPPYPLIEMWDDLFAEFNSDIAQALHDGDGNRAFELMHVELDKVWTHLHRVLKPGGIACINIGDATRTLSNDFRLYPNHARIVQHLHALGFHSLPKIIWRKPTNAPTKFMGSGMLPPGAYVTNEHEYILILRKGHKRTFDEAEKQIRRNSGYFWEERNTWFSDVWMDLTGTQQKLNGKGRNRSAAYPFELAFRLINMYSLKGDMVLDPFAGTGTTTVACMVGGRNSLGFDIDPTLVSGFNVEADRFVHFANNHISQRLCNHIEYVHQHDGQLNHTNVHYGFPVKTNQEQHIILNFVRSLNRENGGFTVTYDESPSLKPEHSQLSLAEFFT